MALNYLTYFLAAFVASFAFGVMYNVPTRTLFASSISGALGWLVYYIIAFQFDFVVFIGAGAASFLVAFFSQWFARHYRMPVIVFAVPAIIPLVPGSSAYNMMRAFIEGNSELALMYGTETFLVSGAIALGLSINSGLFQIFSNRTFAKRDKRYLP
ncbi:MAG: threonine/serine exporter family protein [Alkalibacterium sp.]|uniref:threonine/serine exporter family protein n=1 Tax=Alkalibacterium sp. TaxID=1872447 RepID=UPI003970BB58